MSNTRTKIVYYCKPCKKVHRTELATSFNPKFVVLDSLCRNCLDAIIIDELLNKKW